MDKQASADTACTLWQQMDQPNSFCFACNKVKSLFAHYLVATAGRAGIAAGEAENTLQLVTTLPCALKTLPAFTLVANRLLLC